MNFLFNRQQEKNSSILSSSILTNKFINKKIDKPINNLITFSTCWYIMKSKFAATKYASWIKNLLSISNNFNLVIYTDVKSLKMLILLFNHTKQNIKIIIKPLHEFYTYKYKDYWIKNHLSSTMDLHKQIDWELNMLWNEKPFFVQETIQNKYFDTIYYGWCDIGYFRNGVDDTHTSLLSYWPNHLSLCKEPFKHDYIHYGCIQENVLTYSSLSNDIKEHYKQSLKTPPTNKYTENCFAGGFFILKPKLCKYYATIYDKKLQYYFEHNYFIKDDQFIVMDIIFTNQNMFYIHTENNSYYNNWFMFQRILS